MYQETVFLCLRVHICEIKHYKSLRLDTMNAPYLFSVALLAIVLYDLWGNEWWGTGQSLGASGQHTATHSIVCQSYVHFHLGQRVIVWRE